MSDDGGATAGASSQRRKAGRVRTVMVLGVATATAGALLLIVQVSVVLPAVEADLRTRATAALQDAGYGGVRVDVAGRDVTAAGTVSGDQAAADVEAALVAIPGVRTVAVTDVHLFATPPPADDGVVTSAALRAAVEPGDGADDAAGADPGAVPGAEAAGATVEGSRLLTSGFENATQAPALPALTFIEGSPTLTSDSDAALRAVADQVMADTTGRQFVIRTHTDSVGASAYNQWLSERRAAVVCDGLLALGVPAERLTITGVGESEPQVSPELTEADRATNRRVEILPTV